MVIYIGKDFCSVESTCAENESEDENLAQQATLIYNKLIGINSNEFIFSQYGHKFEDKYQLGQKLKEGSQGSVYSG